MNDTDSKKLKEIEEYFTKEINYRFLAFDYRSLGFIRGKTNWLIAKVKEQDREIENINYHFEFLLGNEQIELGVSKNNPGGERPLQLRVMRIISHYLDQKERAEKAEAELEAQLITYQAKIKEIDALEARIKELEELLGEETYAERAAVRHYKRVKELEQELLWAADACEKAENLLAEKEKV